MSSNAEELHGDADAKRADRVEGGLGRTAAAKLIGVTRSTVGRMVTRGELHPTIDDDGVHWFHVGEVAKVSAARRASAATSPADELAARAFEMFAEHVSLRDVVTQLRLSPERVATLQVQWRAFGKRGDMWLNPDHLKSLADILDFDTATDLVRAVSKLAANQEKLLALLDEREKTTDAEPPNDATSESSTK